MSSPTMPTPTDRILALIGYTDHGDHATCYVFPASGDPAQDARALDALARLPQVAPDPDGWMTYDPQPFAGTLADLRALATRLRVNGCTAGRYFPAAAPTAILAIAEALAGVRGRGVEPPHYAVREFMASMCRTEGYYGAYAEAIRAAAPGVDTACTVLFDFPE